VLNLAFFLSHPIVTPYYTIPIAMLSLWSLMFASLSVDVQFPKFAIPRRSNHSSSWS
jgi:hypothetical protein